MICSFSYHFMLQIMSKTRLGGVQHVKLARVAPTYSYNSRIIDEAITIRYNSVASGSCIDNYRGSARRFTVNGGRSKSKNELIEMWNKTRAIKTETRNKNSKRKRGFESEEDSDEGGENIPSTSRRRIG